MSLSNSLLLISLLHFCYLSHAQISLSPYLILPVTKSNTTLQYTTKIDNPINPINLVIDLNHPYIWLDCVHGSHPNPILTQSLQCSKAITSTKYNKACAIPIRNSVTGFVSSGEVVEDIMQIGSGNGLVSRFNLLLVCVNKLSLTGLVNGVNGVLGLGRSRVSLPSQLGSFGVLRKFTTCLSSSNGALLLGNGINSRSLLYTPLIVSRTDSHSYVINVKSLKVNGKRVSENMIGEAKLSTLVPYTTLESTIYANFVEAYRAAAMAMNMTIVPNVLPFGLCFRDVKMSKRGPVVPEIELVLQSELVKWRLEKTMVVMDDGVVCLGLLDGGLDSESSIVVGGFQLEDTVLEFDFGSNVLGFKSSVSCSDFLLQSTFKE